MSSYRRLKLRFVAPLVFLWAALTAAGTVVHASLWLDTGRYAEHLAAEWCLKATANALQVLLSPIWFFVYLGVGKHDTLITVIAVNAVGWACWIVAALLAWHAWRWFRRPSPVAPAVPSAPANLARRRFLIDATAATGVVATGAAGVAAAYVTPWNLQVRRFEIPVADLPASLDSVRLVHMSDTHLGPRVPLSFINEAVALIRSLRPELVIHTGDFTHMGRRYIDAAAEAMRPLTGPDGPPLGVIGCLGNHDYTGRRKAPVTAALRDAGVRMLINGRCFLHADRRTITEHEPADAALCIAALDDLFHGRIDVRAALAGVRSETPRLLLAHNPESAELPGIGVPFENGDQPLRIDLMLSGHTHGGQVVLPLIGAPYVPKGYGRKYLHGLCIGPRCRVLTTAGVGMSMIPVRFGVPPEVVEITLRRA